MADEFELSYVGTAEETAAQRKVEAQATLREFIAQWDIENIPACDEGMMLLKAFADARPSA
jgi:hypothetical protein